MRGAAAAGIAAVAAAIGAFLLIPHQMIAGTNKISRFGPAIPLHLQRPHCEPVSSVPSGAGFVRLGVVRANPAEALTARGDFSSLGSVPGVGVSVADGEGPISSGFALDFDSGTVDVPLERPTRTAEHARVCVANLGERVLTLYGEGKRQRDGTIRRTLAVTFLDSDSSTWVSRPVLTRFRFGHAGAIGTWALWLAGLLTCAASALALWLMVNRAHPR